MEKAIAIVKISAESVDVHCPKNPTGRRQ